MTYHRKDVAGPILPEERFQSRFFGGTGRDRPLSEPPEHTTKMVLAGEEFGGIIVMDFYTT